MRTLRTLLLAGAALLLFAGAAAAQTAGFKVIANRDNPARGLPRTKIALMFMKSTAKWDGGAAVEPVDLPASSPVRAAFSAAVHNRDVDAVKTAWQRIVFAGRGEPPPEMATDDEVIAFVAGRPGGIGYVSEKAPTDKVKVLDVLR